MRRVIGQWQVTSWGFGMSHVERVEAPLDDFWMRDIGPPFVVDDERHGVLGAVDWTLQRMGRPTLGEVVEGPRDCPDDRRARWERDRELTAGSMKGGGIHTDGNGTVLATETVQLDLYRNPYAGQGQRRGRTASRPGRRFGDLVATCYEDLGTRGHVDMVATIPSPLRLCCIVRTIPNIPTVRLLESSTPSCSISAMQAAPST